MRTLSTLRVSIFASYIFLSAINAQLLPFALGESLEDPTLPSSQSRQSQHRQFQHPMDSATGRTDATTFQGPTGLLDVIGQARSISIFGGFTRDVSSVSTLLNAHKKEQIVILAPLNTAMRALPRKPWESADDYATLGTAAYSGSDGEDRAQGNLRKFTEAHVVVVPKSEKGWEEGVKVENIAGQKVWWEKEKKSGEGEGKILVFPGGVEVEKVERKVSDGEIWSLKGVLDYDN